MHGAPQTLPQDIWELFDVSWAPAEGGLQTHLQRVLERCAGWFKASGATIFMRTDEPGVYRLAARAGSEAGVPDDSTVVEGQGIAGTSVQCGQALLVGDPSAHPVLSKQGLQKRKEIGSSLVIPLIVPDGGCEGVMNLSRPAGKEPFTEVDLRQANALGHFVALSIGNATLFNDLHEAIHTADAAQAKLRGVIGCLGVAVVVVDAEGQVTNQNPEADRLLGDSGPEGRFRGAPTELRRVLMDSLDHALTGEIARVRARASEIDRAWSVVATPVDGGGATAAIEEVTEEERALRERARISRLAEIGQMTATIAHEIRNPLTGIRSAAQMIRESPDDAATFASIVEEEAVKLNGLCDDFLEFAKPLSLRVAPYDLAVLIRRLSASHKKQFEKAGVKLDIEIERGSYRLSGDEVRMEQVLRNLLLNALEASSDGGTVRVVAGPWGFTVEDNGCGMRPDALDRLFTPFFTTKSKGTGLGLSTARKIVEAHGGAIRVESKMGHGTKVEVLMDLAKSADKRLSA